MLIIMFAIRALLLAAIFGFCCWAQAPDRNIAALAGQLFFFPKLGNQAKIHVRKNHLDRIKGDCDIAVQINGAELMGGVARVRLENIGYPVITSQGYRNDCRSGAKSNIDLEISGFASNEPASSVLSIINEVLLTPERYLSYRGIAVRIPVEEPVSDEPDPRGKPDANPITLLSVNPNYTELARAKKYSGTVLISVIVGKDGRAHSPTVIRPLGLGLDENAVRVLPLWRFQPAQKNGKPVACQARLETTFRLL